MDPLSNPVLVLFAAILPLLITLIKQAGFTRQVNAMIAFAAYIIVGVLAVFVSGEEISMDNIINVITVVTTVGTVAYNLVWNNLMTSNDGDLSLDDRLTAATSFIR